MAVVSVGIANGAKNVAAASEDARRRSEGDKIRREDEAQMHVAFIEIFTAIAQLEAAMDMYLKKMEHVANSNQYIPAIADHIPGQVLVVRPNPLAPVGGRAHALLLIEVTLPEAYATPKAAMFAPSGRVTLEGSAHTRGVAVICRRPNQFQAQLRSAVVRPRKRPQTDEWAAANRLAYGNPAWLQEPIKRGPEDF